MPPSDGPASQPPSPPKRSQEGETLPEKIGKYEIQKKLGAGGMGAVYLAFDPSVKRSCALKVLPKEKASNPTMVKRFRAEAAAAANLRHENIVAVYDADVADGQSYIAMEYVDGIDAANHVYRRGVMPEKRSIEIVRQVGQALVHASQHGIVHRDIKPANLIIRRDGAVKLADLGLARSLDEGADAGITRAGTTVGTVDYMAPEQARDSRSADVRSDIYSLGCTWYYLLTGSAPFPEGSLTNKLRAHAELPLPDPRDKNPAVSEAVVAVLRRMTEKDPEQRYQSAEELLRDLEDAALARTVVSNVILDDLADGEKREGKPAKKKYSAPDQSTADIPSPKRKPPPRIRTDVERPEIARAVLFYGGVAAVAVALVVGIGMFVRQLNVTGAPAPVPDVTENPFAPSGGASRPGANVVTVNAEGADGTDPSAEAGAGGPNLVMRASQQPADASQSLPSSPATVTTGRPGEAVGAPVTGNSTVTKGSHGDEAAANPNAPGRAGVVPRGEPPSNRERLENARLPAWVGDAGGEFGLPVLVVQPGSDNSRHYGSLDEALAAVPDQGALILLSGDGPFPVRPVRIERRARIVFRSQNASSGVVPLVVVLSAGDGKAGAGLLEFSGTSVEFDGVHLAADASVFRRDSTEALLHVSDGDLVLRHSSITARRAPSHPIAAVRMSGSQGVSSRSGSPAARLLAHTVLLRGDGLTALDCERAQADVIIRNSLLISGAAPAIRISGSAGAASGPECSIRLASTTVSARRTAFEIDGTPSRAVPVEILLLNSIVAAPAGTEGAALLSLPGWTQTDLRAELAKTLSCKTANSVTAGWKSLIRPGVEFGAALVTPADWQTLWPDREAGDAQQHLSEGWPTPYAAASESFRSEGFDPGTLARLEIKTAEGGRPGCAPQTLQYPGLEDIDSARLAASRRRWPDGLFSDGAIEETVQVDLNREDLGKVLSERKLRNGTLIIASGYGSRQTNPISIRDAWVRLHFQQTEGAPLVLAPRFVDVSRSTDSSPRFDAMISVVNGGLEISGGSFTVPNSAGAHPPRWFIQVTDGDLALRDCRIVGPLVGTTRNKGLIQWQRDRDEPTPNRPISGDYRGYAAFQNCFFLSSGTLFEASLRQRALFLRNCVCVSRDDLFQLDVRGPDATIGGVADFQNCTFSAGDAYLRIASSALSGPASAPLDLFSDRCVFGPSLRTGSQKPTPSLLVCAPALIEQRQLRWRENRCGYAPDLVQFVRGDSEPASTSQSFEQQWASLWGADGVVAPLYGPGQVYLKNELPTRSEDRGRIDAESFRLHPSSKASSWDAGSRAIGADVAVLKALEAGAQAAPGTTARTGGKTTPKNQKPAPKVSF
jgi:eukaryotic-like serine/threonine-protein kinase